MSENEVLTALMNGILADINEQPIVGASSAYVEGFRAGEMFIINSITKNSLKTIGIAADPD